MFEAVAGGTRMLEEQDRGAQPMSRQNYKTT